MLVEQILQYICAHVIWFLSKCIDAHFHILSRYSMMLPSDDNYEQKKELGRGKFGVVFQVEDKVTNKIYAAKHIKTRKKEMKEKVIEEIAILKKFSNPHIIRFINAFETPSEVILVMEYLDGGELFERHADDDFNLTESDCCLFMRQICRGVQYLHKNKIVYLDLKVW